MPGNLSRRNVLVGGAATAAVAAGSGILLSARRDAATSGGPDRGTGQLPGFPSFKTLELTYASSNLRDQLGKVTHNRSFTPQPGEAMEAPLNAGGYPLSFISRNNEWAVHPTTGTNWISQQFSFYQRSGLRKYLDAGLKALTWLVNDATPVIFNGRHAIFTVYRFHWPGADQNPWYSAFGQSHAIGNCIQAWFLTGEAAWLDTAKRFANAYFVPHDAQQPHRPWIMGVDPNGYLWTDETPLTTGKLSGAINALPSGWYGLQKLHQLTGDPDLETISHGVFAALDHCADRVRDFRHISWYDEPHTRRIEHYHLVNILTFHQMYLGTGYLKFAATVDGLLADYPMGNGNYPVHVDGRQTYMVRRNSSTVGKPFSWHNTGADIDCVSTDIQRQWEDEGTERWLLVRSGRMAGYWFQASPHAFEYARGPRNADRPGWLDYSARPRPVTFGANVLVRGYTYDQLGQVTSHREQRFAHPNTATALGRAVIHGTPHALVKDDVFANMWVPLGGAVNFDV